MVALKMNDCKDTTVQTPSLAIDVRALLLFLIV